MVIHFQMKHFVSVSLFVLTLLGFVVSMFLAGSYIYNVRNATGQAYKNAAQTTYDTSQSFNNFINLLNKITTDLAEKLAAGPMDNAAIEAELKKKPVEVSGFGVAFLPEKKLYAPYYVEKDGVQTMVQLESIPNYTYAKEEWFLEPMSGKKAGYGPFSDQVSNNDVIEYAVPFYEVGSTGPDRKPVGIVYATMSMEHLQHLLTTLFFGQQGYWFLVSEEGIVLTHPSKKILYSRTTMADLAKSLSIPQLDQMWKDAMHEKKSSFISYNNEIDGNKSWLFFEAIPMQGFAVLCGVFIQEEIPFDREARRHSFIKVVCMFLVTFLLFCLFLLTYLTLTTRTLWFISGISSLALAMAISFIWVIANLYPGYVDRISPIIDKVNLYQYLISEEDPYATEAEKEKKREKIVNPLELHYKQGDYVPTGIFIRYIRLVGDTQIQITGYVWQRYHEKYHAGLSRGFIFPQATGDVRITKMYDSKQGDETTIIWHITATLNQDISYTKYPFDFKNIQIKLWHNDFEKNVILIPDFNSYVLTNPTVLPGMHPEANITGWQMLRSYFGYKKSTYKTSFGLYRKGPFGIYQRTSKDDTPELHFNIAASRLLTDALISDLVPLAVIILLLFIMILLAPELGTSLLSVAASLFFGAIFAQIRLRSKMPAFGVVYFEYFYFIVYFALFVIICMAMIEKFNIDTQENIYKRNKVISLLFWPLLLIMVLGITLRYLY